MKNTYDIHLLQATGDIIIEVGGMKVYHMHSSIFSEDFYASQRNPKKRLNFIHYCRFAVQKTVQAFFGWKQAFMLRTSYFIHVLGHEKPLTPD